MNAPNHRENRPLRLAALISGGGRTLMNIADRIEAGSLPATMELVICSRHNAPGVHLAASRGLEVAVVVRRDYSSDRTLHDAITSRLLEKGIELVCLCGYLRWLHVEKPFEGRIMNIHPALLPEFGGKGMHGLRVHRAVLAAGRSSSGCTVHFVDDQYDHGPIILQRFCPVLATDDEHRLAVRVFEQECLAYPEAIHLFAQGRLRILDGRVEIASASDEVTK
ncbi:MAG: phosphoribosylglycinamide formyltransferase [Planctomycetes bacterium]|nr:phosphoribosylglycinamide formyltransferase [Planctomycetota bacterium]